MKLILMMILSLVGGTDSPASYSSVHTPLIAESWQAVHDKTSSGELASESEVSSEVREVIVKKALVAIEEMHDPEAYRFSVSPRWIPGSLERIDADRITAVKPEGSVERYTNFTVTYQDRNRVQAANVQLIVETERKLPVANQRILSGTELDKQSLDMRWVSVPYDRGQLVEQMNEIEGKTTRRSLADGQPIRYADISTEFLVEAGDVVQMIFEQNGLRIVLQGEARQSGARDEEITIYNKETRKRYKGRISSPGVVQWTGTL